MNTKVKLTGLALTAMLALSAYGVYAQTGNGGNLTGGQTSLSPTTQVAAAGGADRACCLSKGHKKFHKLNLTDDQEAQLTTILDKQRDAMKIIKESSTLEIKKVLSPEQFEKYLKIMKHQMKNHMKGHRYSKHGGSHKGCDHCDKGHKH